MISKEELVKMLDGIDDYVVTDVKPDERITFFIIFGGVRNDKRA